MLTAAEPLGIKIMERMRSSNKDRIDDKGSNVQRKNNNIFDYYTIWHTAEWLQVKYERMIGSYYRSRI